MPTDKERLSALAKRINETSNADFVKRLLEEKRKYIKNIDGTISTHELGYVDDGKGNAVVFPTVQNNGYGLSRFPFPWSYDRAVANGDTVQMSVPDAKMFTTQYKQYYPDFDYSAGGRIHIKPSKKGTFTAAASKHGKSVQAFASQVLAHKENYSPAMVKKANFARNAAKWHGDGGLIERFGVDAVRKALEARKTTHRYDGETEETQQMNTTGKVPLLGRIKANQISNLTAGKINKNNIGYLYSNPDDWAKKIFSDAEIAEIRQNLYDNFLPFGYGVDELKKAAGAAFLGTSNITDKQHWDNSVYYGSDSAWEDGHDTLWPGIRDEAFGLYLQPSRTRKRLGQGYLLQTDERPTKGKTYDRVYSFNRETNPHFEDNLVNSYWAATSGKRYYPQTEKGEDPFFRKFKKGKSGNNWTVDLRGSSIDGQLGLGTGTPEDILGGTWTLSHGFDPNKGEYVAYYDDYDLNPGVAGRSAGGKVLGFPIKLPDASGGIGTPFSIYDRVYLNDYYGVTPQLKPDEYYGGYIKPVIITAKKKQ